MGKKLKELWAEWRLIRYDDTPERAALEKRINEIELWMRDKGIAKFYTDFDAKHKKDEAKDDMEKMWQLRLDKHNYDRVMGQTQRTGLDAFVFGPRHTGLDEFFWT